MPRTWEDFLCSSALSFPTPSPGAAELRCPKDHYWHEKLLERWAAVYPSCSGDVSVDRKIDGCDVGVSNISYGAHLLLASSLADILRRILSLVVPDNPSNCAENLSLDGASIDGACDEISLRIGIAIPEGPFLPLCVLAVHSLNVAVGECWLQLDSERCNGVALVPLETDEAPERLQHILGDAAPELVLVAPGKDWEGVERAVCDSGTSIELVDFTRLIGEAMDSLDEHTCNTDGRSFADQLWPFNVRDATIDALRYSQAIPGCYDVARLVAIGAISLSNDPPKHALPKGSVNPPSQREIVSHVVYTSGTTGRPKGCVSSLASLQHYIWAKNLAHGIDGSARILLASAVTFDPCLSDVLATCAANATLCIAPRERLYGDLTALLRQLEATHVLCTPTLWATVEGKPSSNVPSLKVVALGGEPIPKSMVGTWARSRRTEREQGDEFDREYPRLYATYGVTEACVYQTFGEVLLNCNESDAGGGSTMPGQSVGLPLLGTNIHICRPCPEDDEAPVATLIPLEPNSSSSEPAIGEVVLSGEQVDAASSYLNLPELTARVFVQREGSDSSLGDDTYFYRTGDLGHIEPSTGNLRLLGRIKGDGMVKLNGIRVELAEIENAVVDDAMVAGDEEGSLVIDCMAKLSSNSPAIQDGNAQQLKKSLIVPPGPLLSVLRERCDRRVRKGCTPSFFVIIDRLPLSPTGKRDRSALPPLAECSVMGSADDGGETASGGASLWECGNSGSALANKICEGLNLQPCQKPLVTADATFSSLGGDSLAATRVVRGLYAQYHGVVDSRNLGGATGTLDGPFAAKHLIQSNALGDYVHFLDKQLDSRAAFQPSENGRLAANDGNGSIKAADPLYEGLLEAVTLGHTAVASALLDLGVNPNSQRDKGGRLGKVTDRKKQRASFVSNPLHLACVRGNPYLVKRLLSGGCRANCPDASGSFPIHLACSRSEGGVGTDKEDIQRRECVRLLLDSGTPISIKDGNKQTILHSAARSGHCLLLKHIMDEWKVAAETTGIKFKSHSNDPGKIYDWHDRWFRTPVHWAVLNGRTAALRILLDGGCSAIPPKPKSGVSKRSTGVVIESPLEMCLRLYYDEDSDIGKEMSRLLRDAM
ncbi:hypothetical protein ACHAXT_010482 [Thalassiosira profunda]